MTNNASNNEYVLPADPDSFTYVNGRVYLRSPEEIERKKLRREGNTIGLMMLLYFFFTVNLADIIYACIDIFSSAMGHFGVSNLAHQLIILGCYAVSIAVPAFIYKFCAGVPFRFAFPARAPKPSVLFPAVFITLGLAMCGNMLAVFLNQLIIPLGAYYPAPALELPQTAAETVVYIITTVVLPPFLEEFFFRGVIMQSVRRFGDSLALLSSALLFALAHIDVPAMPFAFILGLCIGYFVMRTGSLWTGIILHFINNLVSVIFNFTTAGLPYEQSTLAFYAMACAFIILGLTAFAVFCFTQKKPFALMPSKLKLDGRASFKELTGAPCAMIFMCISMFTMLMQVQYV